MSIPNPPQLESGLTNDAKDQELGRLRLQIEHLHAELNDARAALVDARQQINDMRIPLHELRSQLAPLHKALKMVFGEISAVVGADAKADAQDLPRTSVVWDSWKNRLGGAAAKVIDALLLHGEMNTTQLSIATGLHRTTIPTQIYKLNKAGLINKNGGKFSLKEL